MIILFENTQEDFMGLGNIILIGVAGYAVYYLLNNHSSFKNESALDILKKRYAKGEISREEFEEM
ncbi:MAG: SHOCT domain-containing protein, partial [Spirochaetes bacterium]|nr:SHOCT domain-containing protein [Spirochaetota bacterium]